MKSLAALVMSFAFGSLPAPVHAQSGPLQPTRIPGEAVSFAEAHWVEAGGLF